MEIAELVDEGVPVVVLQCVVEGISPTVDQHADGDERELDGDHGGEQ
jgi:hypothetical protein